jgi:DNA topoisomerase VI subunit A
VIILSEDKTDKRKTELEAFSRYGLTYIVDEYLPTKLDQKPTEGKGDKKK